MIADADGFPMDASSCLRSLSRAREQENTNSSSVERSVTRPHANATADDLTRPTINKNKIAEFHLLLSPSPSHHSGGSRLTGAMFDLGLAGVTVLVTGTFTSCCSPVSSFRR